MNATNPFAVGAGFGDNVPSSADQPNGADRRIPLLPCMPGELRFGAIPPAGAVGQADVDTESACPTDQWADVFRSNRQILAERVRIASVIATSAPSPSAPPANTH